MKSGYNDVKEQIYRRKHLRRFRQRFVVLMMSLVLLFPSYQALITYKLQLPVYVADVTELLFCSNVPDAEKYDSIEQLLSEHGQLCEKLKEDNWDLFSMEQRLNILQEVALIEAEYLGVSNVKVEAKKLDEFTLGEFESVACKLTIDVEHLQNDSAEKCLITLFNEMYHSYQHFVVDLIDWERECPNKCLYYKTVREWKENFEYYNDTDYESYYQQSIERDAREYSEKEVNIYLMFIESER